MTDTKHKPYPERMQWKTPVEIPNTCGADVNTVECYEHRYPKHKRPCTVCPVCGRECGMRGGIGQHMKTHIERREVTFVQIPRPAFDNYVDLPDGRRFKV